MDCDQMLKEIRKDTRENFDRIYQIIAKIETDNAAQTENIRNAAEEMQFMHTQYDALDKRLRKTEQTQSKIMGIVIAVGAGITFVLNILFFLWDWIKQ